MGWIPAITVLAMIAAAAGGFCGAVVALRKGPPNRGPFLAGVLCGATVAVALAARRRGLNALGASVLKSVVRPLGRQVPGWSQVFRLPRG